MDKEKTSKTFLRRIFDQPQWFAYPILIISFISIIISLIVSSIKLYNAVKQIITIDAISSLDSGHVSSELLGVIDMVLLIILIYIMSLAVYRFFIGPIRSGGWLTLRTLTDFKLIIAKTTVMFLATFAVHKIVDWEESNLSLYLGGAIIAVCAVLIWYIIVLRKYFEKD